jgi:urease accessory protein UreG
MAAAGIGIGGPVGSGKTALIEALIPVLAGCGTDLAIVTNDRVTEEDAERLRRSGLIDPMRVAAVEAAAYPHTVIREDPTLNIVAGDGLERRWPGLDLLIYESGGDNLASTFSLDVVDWWIFVIDVAGGRPFMADRGIVAGASLGGVVSPLGPYYASGSMLLPDGNALQNGIAFLGCLWAYRRCRTGRERAYVCLRQMAGTSPWDWR